jgi:pyridinium-3,5-biscarboxylic acid mononucleotide sulfurtransferase
MNTENKINKLQEILKEMGTVIVAYSGGIDSTFLSKIAYDVLKENAIAVTGHSETYSKDELNKAIVIAKKINIKHIIIETDEYKNEKFQNNPPDRCYYCKKELFCKLLSLAKKKNIAYVLDGSNFDDTNDYRPGMKATAEFKIRQPLLEVELSKQEIRDYAKKINLPNWNKPSSPCLSSRVPYGEKITTEKIKMVYSAEKYLLDLKLFDNIRVRYHKNIARIEIDKKHFTKLLNVSSEIVSKFNEIGFKYVTLDLQGFRSGSLNELL